MKTKYIFLLIIVMIVSIYSLGFAFDNDDHGLPPGQYRLCKVHNKVVEVISPNAKCNFVPYLFLNAEEHHPAALGPDGKPIPPVHHLGNDECFSEPIEHIFW